jgi:uncharacterized membrane protein
MEYVVCQVLVLAVLIYLFYSQLVQSAFFY